MQARLLADDIAASWPCWTTYRILWRSASSICLWNIDAISSG